MSMDLKNLRSKIFLKYKNYICAPEERQSLNVIRNMP